jgi:GNAT superfamily N-acetyltransferase
VRLIAEDDDGAAGFVTSGPSQDDGASESDAEVRAIYLAERAWGKGLGAELLQGAVDGLRGKGFASAALWVLEGNSRARRFYEREGWTLDGGHKDCFGGVDAPAVRYRRSLEQPK